MVADLIKLHLELGHIMLKLVKLLENVEQNPSEILRKRWWIQMFVWTSLCSSISTLCRLCTAQETLLLRPFYFSLYLYLSSSLSLYFLSLYLYLMQSADIVHGTFLSRPLITVFCPRTSPQHTKMVIMIVMMKMRIITMKMFREDHTEEKVTKL